MAAPPSQGNQVLPKAASVQQVSAPKEIDKPSGAWEKSSFGFRDFIDMINPLQHLPVISTIYRKLTGDEMGSAPRLVGGAIFGGLLGSWVSGLASAVANVFSANATGKDIGDHVLELARPSPHSPPSATSIPANHPEASLTQAAEIRPAESGLITQRTVSFATQHPDMTPDPAPVQLSTVTARTASQGEYGQVQIALEQYRQQMLVDDIRQDTHYWV